MAATAYDAYKLMHDSAQALSRMRNNGIRIDADYYNSASQSLDAKLAALQESIWSSKEGSAWRSKYGDAAKLNASQQISWLLFNHLGLEPTKATEGGASEEGQDDDEGVDAVDREVLSHIDLQICRDLLSYRKYFKVKNTYFKDIMRQEVDGYIHPDFLLHTVVSYRGSCRAPNFQNMPNRDIEQQRLVRAGIIPRRGFRLGEVDFKGAEVCVGACYHHDPVMLDYINDPSKDMHRDVSMQAFYLEPDQVSKEVRHIGKNGFTFPQFYGSTAENCAAHMWEMADSAKLADGTLLKSWMRAKGLSTLKKFERRVVDVCDDFWNRRFRVYTQWKDKFYADYLERGEFWMYTGFRCAGFMKRTKVCNYPVQGSTFHCLLWVLVELEKWLRQTRKRTLVIGQIHDSIVLDVFEDEMESVMSKAMELVQSGLAKHWKWICVPMRAEIEAAPPGSPWCDKKPLKIA